MVVFGFRPERALSFVAFVGNLTGAAGKLSLRTPPRRSLSKMTLKRIRKQAAARDAPRVLARIGASPEEIRGTVARLGQFKYQAPSVRVLRGGNRAVVTGRIQPGG